MADTENNFAPHGLTAQVYAQLRSEILMRQLPDGEPLTELGLAKRLNVSRTPVREALRQLESEGLVRANAGHGFEVRGISFSDINDIYEIRSLVEGEAAARAALSPDEDILKRVDETLDLTEFYIERGDTDKLRELDSRFHRLVYELSGSRMLRHVLEDLHSYAALTRGQSLKTEGRAQHSLEEHRAVAKAIRDRSPEAARRLMIKHVQNTLKNILVQKQESVKRE